MYALLDDTFPTGNDILQTCNNKKPYNTVVYYSIHYSFLAVTYTTPVIILVTHRGVVYLSVKNGCNMFSVHTVFMVVNNDIRT